MKTGLETLGVAAVLVAASVLASGRPSGAGDRGDPRETPARAPTMDRWEMVWDDAVDGVLSAAPHRAEVALAIVGNRVNGSFVGEVCGTARNAIFTGERIPARTTPVVSLQQHEPGYTCVYQLQALTPGLLRGVWTDTEGRSGDVLLRRLEGEGGEVR
jgi:hypothetical protein